jgi:hypothetical protein
MHEDELMYIERLNRIIQQYDSEKRIMLHIIELISIAIVVGVYFIFGYIVCIIICLIFFFCLDRLGVTLKNAPLDKEKLAYYACDAMNALVDIKKGKYIKTGNTRIICVTRGKHEKLYFEFIKYYPGMECKELKRLASIKLSSFYTP